MSQPVWKLIAQLGDAQPLEYGGYFIYQDTTGVYPEEAEWVEIDEPDNENSPVTIYRFGLEKCTYIDGILSDNKYHPDHAAWWAKTEQERLKRPQDTTYLKNLSDQYDDMDVDEFAAMFCSDDATKRAWAYREVGLYHGFDNLDSYPLHMSKAEAEKRYEPKLAPGYAERSARKHPKDPETVVVGDAESKAVRYIGTQWREGKTWNVWKVPNKSRYYFQLRLVR